MNWITVLAGIRTFLLVIFSFTFLSLRLGWFQNSGVLTEEVLNDIINLTVIVFGVLYILELKLKLKQKDTQLAKLKTKLLQYEN